MWSNVLFLLCIKVTSWVKKYKLLASLSSVQFNHSVMSNSSQPYGLQHGRLPCPSPTPSVSSNLCRSSRWCHPTISSSVVPSLPTFNLSQHQGLFNESVLHISRPEYWNFSISLSNEYSGLISFMIDRFDLFYDWQVWFPCSPRDSQESSLISQFKSFSSSVFRFL